MFSPIKESGERIPLTFGVHWVLGLVNPGIDKEKWAATETLWAAYQYILPGEKALPHRHSASAIRFIIEGAVPIPPSRATVALWTKAI